MNREVDPRNILCQFNTHYHGPCQREAFVVIRRMGVDGKDLYVCRQHDLRCHICGTQATHKDLAGDERCEEHKLEQDY